MQPVANPRGLGGPGYASDPNWPYGVFGGAGRNTIPRNFSADNDYLIDREVQRTTSYTGISDFVGQDMMVTESMGAIYDRSNEALGTTDVPIIRMRRILLDAAKGLAQGKEPPALMGDFKNIRAVEKILEPGEDWQVLGTAADPTVQESEAALQAR
jgi:hypothetical protein